MPNPANPQQWSTLTDTSNSSVDSAVIFPEGMNPNQVDDSCRSLMAAVRRYTLDTGGALAAGGTANALTVTTYQGFAGVPALVADGLCLMVQATHANTSAAVTFAPDSLTAAPIKRADGSPLWIGSIQPGMKLVLSYNSGTGEWWALNITPINLSMPIVTLVDGASVGCGAALPAPLTIYRLTTTQNPQIFPPTSPNDGQRMILEVVASGGARTPTLAPNPGNFFLPTDIPSIPTIPGANYAIRIGALYDAGSNFWQVLGVVNGGGSY